MLIDTHCHLNYLHDGDMEAIGQTVADAKAQGVLGFVCIGVDLPALPQVLAISEAFPEVKASVGVHPCDVSSADWAQAQSVLVSHMQHPEVVAIGECGLDYYREEGLDKSLQQTYFAGQIELGVTYNKPLVVHTRQAREDTIAILRATGRYQSRGVMHCFTESKAMATQALDLGFYIAFSGIITFKNAEDLRDVVRHVPLDRLLVETDSPYLAPVPFRGKPNQPAYVVEVAKQVAALKGISYDAVCQQTTANAEDLFAWSPSCG